MALTSASVWPGYRHAGYVLSLANQGAPRRLEQSGGWVIERTIAGGPRCDAMGPYPLFFCDDWLSLPEDVGALRDSGLVSLTLVSDPLLNEREREAFSVFDVARPFKTHFLTELDRPPTRVVSRHHAYYVRRAAREIDVEVVLHPQPFLDEWHALYCQLIARHGISDLRVFSRASFEKLFDMPGVTLFRAVRQYRLVGAQLMLLQDGVAYAHLAAFTDEGYRLGASYILDWHALEHFQGRAEFVNWGGGTGAAGAEDDGLARYKRGWSTQQRLSYLLGVVLDRESYARLSNAHGAAGTAYFPAYRSGEFG